MLMQKSSGVEYPKLYMDADRLSAAAQSSFFRCLKFNLVALFSSSLLLVILEQSKFRTSAVLICLLFSLASIAYLAMKRPQQTWYQSRALAESVKTISWRFMMQSEPYDKPENESQKLLVETMRKLLEDNKDLTLIGNPSVVIPDSMYSVRSLPLKERQPIYVESRIANQSDWYSKKASWNDNWGKRWFQAIVLVHGLALIILIAQLADFDFSQGSIDILLTLSASMVAWTQAKRFEDLATSYGIASHDIGLISALASRRMSSEEFSLFVGDAENAFSREHTQWRARRDS
jgi:SMODS and SLOG-associating 2TM effector domain 1/SMODS and SLOG-associating 2TM effector domain 3